MFAHDGQIGDRQNTPLETAVKRTRVDAGFRMIARGYSYE
jgi:hypothetical protein